jgi:hypothetical protein
MSRYYTNDELTELPSFKKIIQYLEKYEELWYEITEKELGCAEQCGDIAMNIIDETEYYGIDFSNNKRVIQLFFIGSSDCFPAIVFPLCKPNKQKLNLEEYPIHFWDLSSNDLKTTVSKNFKEYMTNMLTSYLLISPTNKEAKRALAELSKFSNVCISYEYKLKHSEEK